MTASVIIAASSLSQGLDLCLAGLREQTMPPDEVIVAGGLDAGEISDYLSDWRELHKPGFRTCGVAAPRADLATILNAGKEAARSSIICFTSDRCVPEKDWLSKIVADFGPPLTGAAGGPVVGSREEMPLARNVIGWGGVRWWGERIDNRDQVPSRKLCVRALSRANMAFRRHLIRDFDQNQRSENNLEEDMCLRLIAMGFEVVCDPAALVRRREPGRQDLRPDAESVSIVNAHHDNTYVFLKHAPLPQKLVFLVYTFLVGDEGFPGLFRRPSRTSPGILPMSRTLLGLKGKLLGLSTYFSHLRQRPRPDRH
jgi:hypothetical protein